MLASHWTVVPSGGEQDVKADVGRELDTCKRQGIDIFHIELLSRFCVLGIVGLTRNRFRLWLPTIWQL